MPKMKLSQGKRRVKVVVGRQLRIGNRKTGKNAHEMTTTDLTAVISGTGGTRARDVMKARKVLRIRGVEDQ